MIRTSKPTSAPAAVPAGVRWARRGLRPLLRGAAHRVLANQDTPWPPARIDAFVGDTWRHVDELLLLGRLDELPTLGSRVNVLLAAVTLAAWEALQDQGCDSEEARDLVRDLGWDLYARGLRAAAWPSRWRRDPQARLEASLRWLLRFPFTSSASPGYVVDAWSEPGAFHTCWSRCPPLDFARRVQHERGGGYLDAFRHSWCSYDEAGADLLAGDGRTGHYLRTQTLSAGDPVCDMVWQSAPRDTEDEELAAIRRIYGWWGRHAAAYAAQDWVTMLGRARHIREAAAAATSAGPGDRVLELGCGTGRNLDALVRRVGTEGYVLGVDMSEDMLAAARILVRRRAWQNVELLRADATTLDVDPGTWDAVVGVLAMSVVPDHLAVLRLCRALLRPGGTMVICDARPFRGRLGALNPLVRALYVDSTRWHPERDLVAALREVFGEVEVHTFNRGTFIVARASAPG